MNVEKKWPGDSEELRRDEKIIYEQGSSRPLRSTSFFLGKVSWRGGRDGA